jgi:AraC-like DNA-binding protein
MTGLLVVDPRTLWCRIMAYRGRSMFGLELWAMSRSGGAIALAHFARSFKATMGLTPHHFVINRRQDRAVELLSISSESLADIATLCGFSDQSHFCRVFKRALGLSPGTWRRCCTTTGPAGGAYRGERVLVRYSVGSRS